MTRSSYRSLLLLFGFLACLGFILTVRLSNSYLARTIPSSTTIVSPTVRLAASRGCSRRSLNRFPLEDSVNERRTKVILPFGRRSAKIATRKGAQDAAKTKLYTKIGKMVADAVKQGGSDPSSNPKLATIMKQANSANVPKDIIKRNIEKGESGKANYEQLVYEAYGAGGVGFVIECMTDNPTMAQRDVKQALKKGLGKWAESGSVSFNFQRRGVIRLPEDKVTEDEVVDVALEAGAEDITEEEEYLKVLTEVENFHIVQSALEEAGLPVEGDQCGLEMIPNAQIEVSDADAEINEDILSRLLDIDDVDAVYSTMAME